MKSTVETLGPTRVRLAVEVPFDELTPSVQRAYKKVAGQVRIPGFRPGKAPARIIDQRVGRGVVLEEAVQDAVPRAYADAVEETGAKVIGQPDIEVTKIDDGDLLAFTAEVDVRPEFELPDVESISVTVDPTEVTDEDIDTQVGQLRDRFAVLKGVERAVQEGDFVSIDLKATVDGEEIPDASSSGLSYEVGSGQLIEGLDAALSGLEAEASKTFTTELVAGDHAGKSAEVEVTVRSVKEKELPELDDEFAQTASEFDTLDELRDDIRERLGRSKVSQQGSQAHDRVLQALLDATEVPLPESAVHSELHWRRDNVDRQLSEAGMDKDAYLQMQGQTQEEFDAELQSNVEQAVKTQLVLDALADAQEVSVSDQDLTEHIVAEAARYGIAPQQLAQQVQESGNIPALIADVRRNKAMRKVLGAATVTDTAGATVDLTALLGPIEDDAAADAAADSGLPGVVEPEQEEETVS
ncbi:MAG TPA: trigger factor [Mycobacteriales bacterium]|nr:trigger factor [Mycobacteriales bacterium]